MDLGAFVETLETEKVIDLEGVKQNTLSAGRNPSWDIVKGVLIFCVVLAHTRRIGNYQVQLDELAKFIYLFHMSAFVFISGFFFKAEINNPRRAFGKIGYRLTVPYLLSGFLFFFARYIAESVHIQTTMTLDCSVWHGLWDIVAGNYGALWFLCYLIVLQSGILLIGILTQRKGLSLLLPGIGGILCWWVLLKWMPDSRQYFILYFLLGMAVRHLGWTWQRCWWGIPLAVLLFWFNEEELYVKIMPYTVCFVVAVVVGLKYFGDCCVKCATWLARPLSYVGRHTLIILCLHPLFNPVVAIPLEWILNQSGERSGIGFMFLSSAIVTGLCLIVGFAGKFLRPIGCRIKKKWNLEISSNVSNSAG